MERFEILSFDDVKDMSTEQIEFKINEYLDVLVDIYGFSHDDAAALISNVVVLYTNHAIKTKL